MDSRSNKPSNSGEIQITVSISESKSNSTFRPTSRQNPQYQVSHVYANANSRTSYGKTSGGYEKKSGCGSGCLTPIFAIFLFFCLLASCGGEPEPDMTPSEDEATITQEHVPEAKSPSDDISNFDGKDILEQDSTFSTPTVNPEEISPESEPEPEAPFEESQVPPSTQIPRDPLARDPAPETSTVTDPLFRPD